MLSTESENIRKNLPIHYKNFEYFYKLNRDGNIEKENLIGKFIKIGSERPRLVYVMSKGEEKHLITLNGQNIDNSDWKIGFDKPPTELLTKKNGISLILALFSGTVIFDYQHHRDCVCGKWCLILNAEKLYLTALQSFDYIGPFE